MPKILLSLFLSLIARHSFANDITAEFSADRLSHTPPSGLAGYDDLTTGLIVYSLIIAVYALYWLKQKI